nr:hypothetical protein Iba_chr04aCG19370 [Ipomoea batatas]
MDVRSRANEALMELAICRCITTAGGGKGTGRAAEELGAVADAGRVSINDLAKEMIPCEWRGENFEWVREGSDAATGDSGPLGKESGVLGVDSGLLVEAECSAEVRSDDSGLVVE